VRRRLTCAGMHCARCGTEAREGDQFCRECGAELRGAGADATPRRPLGERLRRLAGRTRGERLLAAGTVIAIVVAIAAFIALDTPEDQQEEDRYTATADLICIESKRAIAAAGARGLTAGGGTAAERYASDLVRETTNWRSRFDELTPPGDRSADAQALSAALLEVSVSASDLARAARSGSDADAAEAAAAVDEASVGVEEAIDELGLQRCGELAFTAPPEAAG
jgi:hypothetical protein